MNKSFTILAFASAMAIIGSLVFSSEVAPLEAQQTSSIQTASSNARQQIGTAYQYATLTTRVIKDNSTSKQSYEVVWNNGDTLVSVSSKVSLEDAYRSMINRRRGTVGRINLLSSLLNHFGAEGWELIETQNDGSLNARVFIRRP